MKKTLALLLCLVMALSVLTACGSSNTAASTADQSTASDSTGSDAAAAPAGTGHKETLVIGTLSIHLPSLSVTLDGHKLALTRREVELLYTLASSPGRVFTRDNLLTLVWGYEHVGNYRAVDSHIKRLRQKLDAYPHDFFTIATVWGTGYKFERRLP